MNKEEKRRILDACTDLSLDERVVLIHHLGLELTEEEQKHLSELSQYSYGVNLIAANAKFKEAKKQLEAGR